MIGYIFTNFLWKLFGHGENPRLVQAEYAVGMNQSQIDEYQARLDDVRRRKQIALDTDDVWEFHALVAEEDSLMRLRAAARIGSIDANVERIFAEHAG